MSQASAGNVLTAQQADALLQFRTAVAELPYKPEESDQYYLRWLKARKFNVNKAVDMFKQHLEWRQDNSMDSILQWSPPEVCKFYPGGNFGEDKEGSPVFYDFPGNVAPRDWVKAITHEDLRKFFLFRGEKVCALLKELSQKRPNFNAKTVIISNMENFSYQRNIHWPSVQRGQKLWKEYQDNYPELLKRIIVINAPRVFPILYNMFKRFIDEETRKKIIVLGRDWKEKLQEYIAADQLPQAYGGTRCEPDPQCSAHINWGGDIPKEYFLSYLIEAKRDDMEKVTVRTGSTFQLELEVEQVRTVISWEFMTTSYDIGFGVLFKSKENSKLESILPVKRMNTHEVPEIGLHHCDRTGTYLLKFDNTYSWTRSKELLYLIKVLPPDTQDEELFRDCLEDATVQAPTSPDM